MNVFCSDSFIVRWTKFFLNRHKISVLLLIAIIIAGFWGAFNNQRQDFPDIPSNFIFVQSIYPGASPSDMEQDVAIPIEQAAGEIKGVASIRSEVGNSFAFISVEMEKIPETEKAATKLSDSIGNIGLPSEVETDIQVLEPAAESMALAIVGYNGQSTNDLLQYASDIQPRLEGSSNEIKAVTVQPANEFKVKIILDAEKLKKARLDYSTVKSSIQSYISALPGGSLEDAKGREKTINIKAAALTLEELKNISFGPVKLEGIAEIERVPKADETLISVGYKDTNKTYAGPGVYLIVEKKGDGDVINISEAVKSKIDEIKNDNIIPEDIDILVGYDGAPAVQNQIYSLLENGYYGLIIILIVLLFFINFRTAIIVALIIPLAFLMTLFIFPLVGFTINILTLYAMILALGILVDNAIVIAEGIVYELERGKKKFEASINAVKKLGPSVTAATLTTIIVFIPFAFLGGLMGAFLKYIPYTFMIMIAVSYFLAISITPLFGKWFSREETSKERHKKQMPNWQRYLIFPAIVRSGQQFIDKLNRVYGRFMNWSLFCAWRKIVVVSTALVLLVVSLSVFAPRLKFEQMPTTDTDIMTINVVFPAGTPFEEKSETLEYVQKSLVEVPYFKTSYTWGTLVQAMFVEPSERTDEKTMDDLVEIFNTNIAEYDEFINDDVIIRPEKMSHGPPEPEYDVIVEFKGNDTQKLFAAVDDLEKFYKEQEGIKKIFHGPREASIPSIDVVLDQDKLAQKSVNPFIASQTVNAVFSEQKVGSFVVREDGVSDDVILVFNDKSTDSIDDLKNLLVPTLTGSMTSLSDISEIKEINEPETINRLDHQRVASISLNLLNSDDRAEIQQKVENYLTEDKLEALGLEKDAVSYGGLFATFQSDYSNLQIIFLLAMIMVYLILVYQFNSFSEPLLIIFAVPLALIGVFPGLLLVGSSLNMVSGLGIIALVGIVVNDAIVLISTFNRFREENPDKKIKDILIMTGQVRFKPIFSTSITTIGGIIILTVRDPFWIGLGTSIITGLIFSTIGTLIIIPTLYSIFSKRKGEKRLPECESN